MTEVSFDKLCDSKIDIPVLPEGCSMTKAIRDAHFRIAHITRDQYGNFHERLGKLFKTPISERWGSRFV